jgi:hypothetical protein
MAGTLDNITVYVGIHDNGVINVKWTWQNESGHTRQVFGVPQEIVNTTPKAARLIQDTLDKYIVIRDRPFQIDFTARITTGTPETTLTLKGLLFDEYLSWVNVTAYA